MMATTLDQLYLQAQSLPLADRAALAGRLLHNLEGPPDEGIEEAWLDEIQRRLAAYDSGQVQAIPAGEVLEAIRSRHRP